MIPSGSTCVARNNAGLPCHNPPVKGAKVCRFHGGALPRVRELGLVRYEVSQWVAGDEKDDPGEVLLRLITQSRRRADLYASLLEEAYTSAEAEDLIGAGPILGTRWRMPAGVSALIGHKYAVDPQGGPSIPIAEAVRGLVELEASERDRCANFCIKAIAAGLAERVVRMQERDAAMAHKALIAGLDAAHIVGEQRALVLDGAASHLRLVSV